MSKVVFHPANSRDYADHGWLKSYHTFSFANYYHPERVHFGMLRVLNDDKIGPGEGFGTHPHDNMEIISIPIEGKLAHKDSMGNIEIIGSGEIQVMSAGSGITHSEYNPDDQHWGNFLQIWVFPQTKNVEPRYNQVKYDLSTTINSLQELVAPQNASKGLWIHQNAWFYIGRFDPGYTQKYQLNALNNGVYVFVIEGKIKIGEQFLDRRDGFGIWETDSFDFEILADTQLLIMEVPMH